MMSCALMALAASLLVGSTLAQPRWPGKPAHPGPGEMRRSYSRSGAVGQGCQPLSAWSYQNSARVNAQSLYLYGENCRDVDPATVKEHVAEIRRNVAAANGELDKLDEQTTQKCKIADEVQALRKNYAAIEEHCGMAEKCVTGNGVNTGKLSECCGSLEDELDAAHKTHQQMLDKLGIEQVDPQPAPETIEGRKVQEVVLTTVVFCDVDAGGECRSLRPFPAQDSIQYAGMRLQTALLTSIALLHLAGTALHGAPPSEPAQVTLERVPDHGIQPQVVSTPDGTLHLLYFTGDAQAGDVHYTRRSPGQSAFTKPVRVNVLAGSVIAAGTIRGAQLAVTSSGTVHVAWNGSRHAEPKGPDGQLPLLYSRLLPNSATFEPQRNLISTAYGLDGGACITADSAGNVYVAWHAGEKQEDSRRVWLVHSMNDGESFSEERAIDSERVGACGCCGMSASVAPGGQAMFLYRSAREDVHRDMYLLTSDGNGFKSAKLHDWTIKACPMSSAAFAQGGGQSWAAWETDEQVYFAELGSSPATLRPQPAPGKGMHRKHPRMAVNDRGELLLLWTEGTGWKKGGSVAWQVYDAEGRPTAATGGADGVPVWSFAAPYAEADGRFVILY